MAYTTQTLCDKEETVHRSISICFSTFNFERRSSVVSLKPYRIAHSSHTINRRRRKHSSHPTTILRMRNFASVKQLYYAISFYELIIHSHVNALFFVLSRIFCTFAWEISGERETELNDDFHILSLCVYVVAAMISYNVVVGDTLSKVLIRFLPAWDISMGTVRFIVVFVVNICVVIPLCLYKNVSRLARASFISLACVVFILFAVTLKLFSGDYDVV